MRRSTEGRSLAPPAAGACTRPGSCVHRNPHFVGSGHWWRLGVLAGFVGAATIVALVVDLPSVARIQALTSHAGPFGVAGFALGYALLTLGPVPKAVMSAAAGLLFGWVPGALVVWVASLLGALAGFWLGRWLGRGAVDRIAGTRMGRVDDLLARRGVAAVLAGRLMPVVPFTGINYVAGLSGARLGHFMIGTAVGIVPGTLGSVAVGAFGSRLVS